MTNVYEITFYFYFTSYQHFSCHSGYCVSKGMTSLITYRDLQSHMTCFYYVIQGPGTNLNCHLMFSHLLTRKLWQNNQLQTWLQEVDFILSTSWFLVNPTCHQAVQPFSSFLTSIMIYKLGFTSLFYHLTWAECNF